MTGAHLCLGVALAFSLGLPAAERWEMRYFYDKYDSALAITDLQFPSSRYGIAVGVLTDTRRPRPVLLVTTNGGAAWELLPLKDVGVSLFFRDEQAGWMVTQNGRLLKTVEAGRSWQPVRLEGVRARPLRVFFLDESRGWLLCAQKQVFSTRDGGRSWQLLEESRAPDLPADQSAYTWAAFRNPQLGLLSGSSRAPHRQRRFPDWMEPERAPLGRNPTTGLLLHTGDGGQTWRSRLLPNQGEIIRLRIPASGAALVLVQRPDSLSVASEILALDLETLQTRPVYGDKNRWLTDLALAGPGRVFAAAIDQEGRTAMPVIPSRLKVLDSAAQWKEMEVDYRAEARRAIFAGADPAHAWLATDTGMILQLVRD